MFQLLDKNRGVMELMKDTEAFEAHLELHRRSDEFFADTSVPLDDRMHLALALGAATGLVGFGGSMLLEDPVEVRRVVAQAVKKLL